MADARRLTVAVVALGGLVLSVMGAWSALVLGPDGRLTATGSSAGPLLVGPSVLNRVDGPVTVEATSPDGPVWLATAVPQDARDALGAGRHEEVLVVRLPSRTLQLASTGDVQAPDPRPFHVWRATGEGRLVVRQSDAPESVVVYPTGPGPVLVSLTWRQTGWFLESLAVLVVGLFVLGVAGGWLRARLRPRGGPEDAAGTRPADLEPDT